MSNRKKSNIKSKNTKLKNTKSKNKQKLSLNLIYEKNKGIIKQIDYKKHNNNKILNYEMICRLNAPQLLQIKKNPHSAHFFCNYDNVFFCNTKSEKDKCDKMTGIRYNRQFKPDIYRGKEPYIKYLLQQDDLLNQIGKKINYPINLDFINYYEALTYAIENKFIDNLSNSISSKLLLNNNNKIKVSNIIKVFETVSKDKYVFKNISQNQNNNNLTIVEIGQYWTFNQSNAKNLLSQNLIMEVSIPLNSGGVKLLHYCYCLGNLFFYKAQYQNYNQTFFAFYIPNNEKIKKINELDKLPNVENLTDNMAEHRAFIFQLNKVYRTYSSNLEIYLDKLINIRNNLTNLSQNDIRELQQFTKIKSQEWIDKFWN